MDNVYVIEPSPNLYERYPNLCVIPMIHNVDAQETENIPLVVINLSSDEICLSKGETMGFYAKSIIGYIQNND